MNPRDYSAGDPPSMRTAGRDLPPVSAAGPGSSIVIDLATSFEPHDIAGYELINVCGEGGMGTVWQAVQLSTRRQVALKLMRADVVGSVKNRARFEREVELAARLEHANIARIYDSGLTDGVYYYAMQFVDGVHLDQFIQQNRPAPERMLRLFIKVCQAVEHAHQRGVLHRDLKPSNILVTSDGEPHVVDFGLAIAADAPGDRAVSMAGDVVGTLPYMSPEQVRCAADAVDVRTDVYALGVVLYEMLVGEMPHDPSGTRLELQSRIIRGEIQRPLKRSANVDRELEAIMLKAMAAHGDARYQSVHELAADVTNYLTGHPLMVRPLTVGYFLWKWVRRHRTPLAAIGVAALVLGAVVAGAFVAVNATQQRAARDADDAEHARYLSHIVDARAELQRGNHRQATVLLDATPVGQRGWEWSVLRQQADSSLWTTRVDGGIVNVLPMRQGAMLAVVTDHGRIDMLRADTGATSHVIDLPIDHLVHRAALVEGEAFVCVTIDGRIRAFDDRTGQSLWSHDIQVMGQAGNSLATCLPRGQVAVMAQGMVTIYAVRSGQMIHQFQPPGQVRDVTFSPDGERLICVGTVTSIWDTDTAKRVHTLTDSDDDVTGAIFSRDGRMMLLRSKQTTSLWDTATWTRRRDFASSQAYPAFEFGAGDTWCCLVGEGDGIHLMNIDDGSEDRVLYGHGQQIRGLRAVADSSDLISFDHTFVKRWVPDRTNRSDYVLPSPPSAPTHVNAVAVGPTGRWLAAAAREQVHLVDRETGRTFAMPGHRSMICSVGFDPTGRYVASAGMDRQVIVWDVWKQSVVHRWQFDQRVYAWVDFSADGDKVLAGSDRGVDVMSMRTGRVEFHLLDHGRSSAYCRGRNQIAAIVWSEHAPRRRLVIWDVARSRQVSEMPIDDAADCVFVGRRSLDRVAWVVDRRTLVMHDLVRSATARTADDGSSEFYLSAMSPDGRRVLSAGPTVRLRDASTGVSMIELHKRLDAGAYQAVAFSDDGTTVVAAEAAHLFVWSSPRSSAVRGRPGLASIVR